MTVLIKEARNLRNTQTFGTQDPYVKVSLGKSKFKTKVHDDGGKMGKWNERFTLRCINPVTDKISISVRNQNVVSFLVKSCYFVIYITFYRCPVK
jgi:Ca2+-dependent lipid-binding protein